MFDVPDEAKARGIVAAADPVLDRLAELIRERKPFPQPKVSAADKLKSGVVNKAFYPLLVHAKQFTVNEKCTGLRPVREALPDMRHHAARRPSGLGG